MSNLQFSIPHIPIQPKDLTFIYGGTGVKEQQRTNGHTRPLLSIEGRFFQNRKKSVLIFSKSHFFTCVFFGFNCKVFLLVLYNKHPRHLPVVALQLEQVVLLVHHHFHFHFQNYYCLVFYSVF